MTEQAKKLMRLYRRVQETEQALHNMPETADDQHLKRAMWLIYNLWSSDEYHAIEEYLREKGAKSVMDAP